MSRSEYYRNAYSSVIELEDWEFFDEMIGGTFCREIVGENFIELCHFLLDDTFEYAFTVKVPDVRGEKDEIARIIGVHDEFPENAHELMAEKVVAYVEKDPEGFARNVYQMAKNCWDDRCQAAIDDFKRINRKWKPELDEEKFWGLQEIDLRYRDEDYERGYNMPWDLAKLDLKSATTKLLEAFYMGHGASMACANVLRCVHSGRGELDWSEIFRMDRENREAAMYLLQSGLENRIPHDGLPLSDQAKADLWAIA